MNRKDADDCLKNRKKLRDFDREAVGLQTDAAIFVNENLSPYISKLSYYCRQLKRKGLVDKTTCFKGVVKVTRTVQDNLGDNRIESAVISHKQDLETLFPNLDVILNLN